MRFPYAARRVSPDERRCDAASAGRSTIRIRLARLDRRGADVPAEVRCRAPGAARRRRFRCAKHSTTAPPALDCARTIARRGIGVCATARSTSAPAKSPTRRLNVRGDYQHVLSMAQSRECRRRGRDETRAPRVQTSRGTRCAARDRAMPTQPALLTLLNDLHDHMASLTIENPHYEHRVERLGLDAPARRTARARLHGDRTRGDGSVRRRIARTRGRRSAPASSVHDQRFADAASDVRRSRAASARVHRRRERSRPRHGARRDVGHVQRDRSRCDRHSRRLSAGARTVSGVRSDLRRVLGARRLDRRCGTDVGDSWQPSAAPRAETQRFARRRGADRNAEGFGCAVGERRVALAGRSQPRRARASRFT